MASCYPDPKHELGPRFGFLTSPNYGLGSSIFCLGVCAVACALNPKPLSLSDGQEDVVSSEAVCRNLQEKSSVAPT